ncbi:MAG: ABC transporter permease [SAR324 cluster bacterium]|nr:ABC transporter permease [SAR324 cluster bacterium]
MQRYILARIIAFFPVLFGVALLSFSAVHLVPGNVVNIMAGEEYLSPEKEAALLKELGLDKPIYVQFALWLWKIVQGDFGISYTSGLPVSDQLLHRLPVNIELMLIAFLLIVTVGILGGIVAAAYQFTWIDYAIRFFSTLGYSIPNFWLATLFILLGSLVWTWLPVLDYVPFREDPIGNITSMLIPGFVLGLASLAFVLRMTRSSVLENMRMDYVRTARAKGLPEQVVFMLHITKNSLIPVVTVIGLQVGFMVGGFVLTEEVFVLPGLGRLLLVAISSRDFNIITAITLLTAVIVLIINLLVDILYAFIDPRIRY